MSKYFAKINQDNIVEDVIVAESLDWVVSNFDGNWIETFVDNPNKPMAGVGFEYILDLDIFREVKPFESWILSDNQLFWTAPIPMPQDGKLYDWNEEQVNWVEINE